MNCVLLTGFEPFGGELENPSGLVAVSLDGVEIATRKVVGRVLPCVFGAAPKVLEELMTEFRPEWVICLGVAAGRSEITPERVAINVDDARIQDNAGNQPQNQPIVEGGPVGYWSTLPIHRMVAALREDGIPASISESAGTFVCNHVFYSLMHRLVHTPGLARGGFIHIPPVAGAESSGPRASLDALVRGVRRAIQTCLD